MTRDEVLKLCLDAFRRESPKREHSKYGGCRNPFQTMELTVDTLIEAGVLTISAVA